MECKDLFLQRNSRRRRLWLFVSTMSSLKQEKWWKGSEWMVKVKTKSVSSFSNFYWPLTTDNTARKIGFTQIYSVQIWCKKLQTRSKSKAKMVNTAFAFLFTWGCKFESKCGIYHLCLIFNLSLHFFAPNLHWVNLM